MLRDRRKYPNKFYYFSIVANFILRFAWILSLIPQSVFSVTFQEFQILFFIQSVLEIYRRAQWSLFRVENENVNNFEKYRVILDIPELLEDDVDKSK